MSPFDADATVQRLGLAPHPEGGFYRETFRASSGASSLIYYLLRGGELSALHRVRDRDEAWHHYAGATLRLHVVHASGAYETFRLGADLAAGEVHHAVVPANAWQAAEAEHGAVLVGCTVAPAFDFAAFDLPPRAELRDILRGSELPDDVLVRLTRR